MSDQARKYSFENKGYDHQARRLVFWYDSTVSESSFKRQIPKNIYLLK